MKNSFLRINYKKIVSGKGLVFVLYWFLVSKYHHPSYSCQGCAGPYHMGSTRYIMATVVTAYYYSSLLPFKEWVRPLMLFPILEFVSSFLTVFNYFPNQCPCSYPQFVITVDKTNREDGSKLSISGNVIFRCGLIH